MRIGIVAPGSPGSSAIRVARANARELEEAGHSVVLMALGEGDRAVPGDEVLFGEGAGRVARLSAAAVDLVHVHGWHGLGTKLVRRLSCEVPVVLTLHDACGVCPEGDRPEPTLARCVSPRDRAGGAPFGSSTSWAQERVAGRTRSLAAELAAARTVVFPSLTHLVRTREFFTLRPDRVRIQPFGLLEAPASSITRPRPWRGTGPLTFFFTGHRSIERGTLDLVAALVDQPTGTVRLVARGTTDGEAFDARLMDLARGRFELDLGPPVSMDEMVRLAADCHVAALPSRQQESYSLELDEVLAVGLPAWITFADVARERFDRACFEALPAGDVQAWSAAMREVLDDPRRSKRAFETLPVDVPRASVDALVSIYDDALHTKSASRAA